MTQKAAPAVQDLARKLLALETNRNDLPEATRQAVLNVFERLRLHLSKLVGVSGY